MSTNTKQEAPDRVWIRAEILADAELLEHFKKLNDNDVQYVRADALATARRDVVEAFMQAVGEFTSANIRRVDLYAKMQEVGRQALESAAAKEREK